jgi:allantoin racemase
MRLQIINPDTTQAVTDRVLQEARRYGHADTDITAVTAAFGVAVVSTQAELVIAAHAALDLLAAYAPGHDAAIVAISFDASAMPARRRSAVRPLIPTLAQKGPFR